MQLAQYKTYFLQEIASLYESNEALNFFNLLQEAYLNMNRLDAALNPNFKINKEQLTQFNKALSQLKHEKPIQYIIGKTSFYGLDFQVNEHTLIPRPETEELVSWIIENCPTDKTIRILDIGTGSGCIAIALAKNLTNAQVTALDVSAETLAVANQNAILNNVKIQFIKTDILKATTLDNHYDIIVSNPPYVRELEKKEIQKNVLEYEPHTALFVEDTNALIFYDKIANLAKDGLVKDGLLFFEINQYLGKETLELIKEKGFKTLKLKQDIFKNDRMIKAKI